MIVFRKTTETKTKYFSKEIITFSWLENTKELITIKD